MGTTIRLSVYKGNCKPKQWNKFKDSFHLYFSDQTVDDSGDFISIEEIYTSYHSADVNEIMKEFKAFKGSGIEFSLWFEERDPDEQGVL